MGSSKEFYFQYPFVWYALIVGTLAIGYLLMNIFSTGPNLSGDVCSTLFGSTSILTLTHEEVLLCAVLSITVVILFILLYLAKIYKTHGGNLPDDSYIYRMWKSYDIEENIKKEIDYDLVKMDKDEVYATVYQIDGDNKYCRLANAVIK